MLASLNLLNRFLDLPRSGQSTSPKGGLGLDYDLVTLSDILTRQGFEVEGTQVRGSGLEAVVVGRILDATMHPQADRLRICKVDVGDSAPKQIVCGAPNARTGLFVAVALPGSTLPGGLTIVESTIRGVESRGMLCSREELGLSKIAGEPDGIWELDSRVSCGQPAEILGSRMGQPVFRALELADIILDLAVTPNRPDCLCHLGLAREIWAGLLFAGKETKWHGIEWLRREAIQNAVSGKHPVTSGSDETPHGAPSFSELAQTLGSPGAAAAAILFTATSRSAGDEPRGEKSFTSQNDLGVRAFFTGYTGVKPKASPPWLRRILESLEQNSVNDVVDLSNLILICFGQPSHAFDLDKFGQDSDSGVWLRQARDKEEFTGLDGKARSLHPEDCVVAAWNGTRENSRPEALLGVIGGEHSKVDETSTRIIVEWANPDPVKVRRTSRRIGRKTDSSFQFEKGLDRAARLTAATLFGEILCLLQPAVRYCGIAGRSDDTDILAVANSAAGVFPPHPDKDIPGFVAWTKQDLGNFLGQSSTGEPLLPWALQLTVLTRLGFALHSADPERRPLAVDDAASCEAIHLLIPHWRWIDVDAKADIAEELARMKGIDAVVPVPMTSVLESKPDDTHLSLFERVAVIFAHLGYTEVSSFHFMKEDDLERLGFEGPDALGEPVQLVNPIIGDEPLLHTTLIPDLLRKVKRNVNRGTQRGQLFHICRTFQNLDIEGRPVLDSKSPSGSVPPSVLMGSAYAPSLRLDTSAEDAVRERPSETPRLAGIVFGNREERSWRSPQANTWVIQDLLAHLDEFAAQLGIRLQIRPLEAEEPFAKSLHPKRSAAVLGITGAGDAHPLGWVGEFHPRVLRAFEVDAFVMGFELNLAEIHRLSQDQNEMLRPEYKPHRLPLLRRDFAVVVPETTPSAALTDCVKEAFEEFIRLESNQAAQMRSESGQHASLGVADFARLLDCRVFDVYIGDKVQSGHKSVAFEVIAEPLETSFTEETISSLSRLIVAKLEAKLGALLRA